MHSVILIFVTKQFSFWKWFSRNNFIGHFKLWLIVYDLGSNLWRQNYDWFNLGRITFLCSNDISNKNRTVCNQWTSWFQNQTNIRIYRIEFCYIIWYWRVFIFFLQFQFIVYDGLFVHGPWTVQIGRPEIVTGTFITMIIYSKTSTNIDHRIWNVDKRPNRFQNKFQSRDKITNRFQLWDRATQMTVDAMKTLRISMKDDIGDKSRECPRQVSESKSLNQSLDFL